MKISAPTTDNLIFDPAELDAARVIVVAIPGAFSRITIFDALHDWRGEGYGLVFYRFPALDGRPLTPALNIAEAASEIVALADRYPEKPLCLLGYSTGGAIALKAATQIAREVKVAGMSTAVDRGGGLETALRVARDLARSALAVRSLQLEPVWLDYYRVLLFGAAVRHDRALAIRAAQLIEKRRSKIILPDDGKPHAHTSDLRRWRLPQDAGFHPGQVRLFWGMEDPVFSRAQTLGFARRLGPAAVIGYPGQGHLLFASHLPVFDDILAFFQDSPSDQGGGVALS